MANLFSTVLDHPHSIVPLECFTLGPHTLLIGGLLGAIGGYALHFGAADAYRRIKISRDYQDKYQSYLSSKQN